MPKQIWLAPILSDNRERLLERAADLLTSEPAERLVYLAASRPLLDLAADRLLDGVRNRGVWGSLPVHLFRGFARYILATAIDEQNQLPLAPRIAIDQDALPLKRSLISQILKRLAAEGKLRAIAPLAYREGCINTVASLIGEIQRAGKRPEEFALIVEARARDFYEPDSDRASQDLPVELIAEVNSGAVPRQVDFDRDIARIYSAYSSAIALSGFTEDDSDQLRALDVLRGEVDGRTVCLPWLADVRMLVLDGFFDFTPVQGEMLRLLIPRIPEVIINLNRDESNAEIFRAFSPTIDQLNSIATFETRVDVDNQAVSAGLSQLRQRLFNPMSPSSDLTEQTEEFGDSGITLLEADNRQTEIRAIAKRMKQLVLVDDYALSEIALVVRELSAYAETIVRVFEEESIPCSLRRRIQLPEVPAARAAAKLFELLIELNREDAGIVKVSSVAGLIKSGYFRLSDAEIEALRTRFTREYGHLLSVPGYRRGPDETRVGQWDADELENVIAFVGTELRLDRWLTRARHLTGSAPAPDPDIDRDLKADDEEETETEDAGEAVTDQRVTTLRRAVRAEPVEVPLPGSERRSKPAREIHPALIAWSALVVEGIGQILARPPREGRLKELRGALIRVLEELQFSEQVRGPRSRAAEEIAGLALDLRALEGLRRALSAAVRSIETSERAAVDYGPRGQIKMATLLDETMRCVKSQSLVLSGSDPSGLKVLEATDIRGLRFRAVFIAGLVEGGFPLRASRDWIYPHEERERLKHYGLTLEDISPQTLLKEEHYFYQAACRATEQLYLSRPLVSDDGAETIASYYIDELVHAVAPSRIRKEVVRNDFDGQRLFESSRTSELVMLLVRQEERPRHRAQKEETFPSALIDRMISQARSSGYLSESAVRRIAIERERGSRSFGRFDGVIADESLLERLAKQYDAEHPFNASELSLYGRCPFKFFAEKLLKLEPRGEAALDLSALDAGSLLHEVLRRFFERYRGERLTGRNRAELRQELRAVADEVFDEHQNAVPPLNPKVWKIDREIRKLLLEQVLDYELSVEDKTQTKDVRPAYFELGFGMTGGAVDPHSTEQRLRFYRTLADHTEALLLRGKIDRVDLARDETAIAYDYKLSRGPSIDDMCEGRALQLHIYLAALEQLLLPGHQIAGGGYYTMKGAGARRNQGLYRLNMKEYTGVGQKTSSSLSDADWTRVRAEMESRIWEFVDGMRAGRFEVDPSAPDDSCPHCDYSAVCRYEKFRIRRKDR